MELQSVYRELGEGRASLDVTVPAEAAEELIDRFTIALAYQNGVSPAVGQSLEDALVEKLGRPTLDEQIARSLEGHAFPFAADSKGASIVGRPAFSAPAGPARGEAFCFEARFALRPSFGLSSYGPVEIDVEPLELDDADVAEFLNALARKHARVEKDASRRDVREGDLVELGIETVKDGERYEQLCAESRAYTAGARLMPEGFDREVMKMKVGETKTFSYECPAFAPDEGAPAEGAPAETERYTSTVTVRQLQKTIVPELNDEWIRENLPEFDGLASLTAHARSTVLARKSVEHRHYKNLQSARKLAERLEGEIPDAVYQAVVEDVEEAFAEQLAQQGSSKEDFLRRQGMSEEKLRSQLRSRMRDQLTRQFALDALAEHLELEVSDEDLDEYFRAAASPGLEAMVRLDFERNGKMPEARLSALRLKANDYASEHAEVRGRAEAGGRTEAGVRKPE